MKIISSSLFLKMIRGGVENLDVHREEVNDLNVFPVPDGDTGDNMLMTISPILETPFDEEMGISEMAKKVASLALLSARGNSGVILSQILKGLADGLANYTEINVASFHFAMETSVKTAYTAVTKPVEGTILSVLRDAVAGTEVTEGMNFEEYFDVLTGAMKQALDNTPNQMELLAENGVVDSGGAGLYYVFEGMKNALEGSKSASKSDLSVSAMGKPSVAKSGSTVVSGAKNIDVSLFTENSELEYGYCTEFLLRLQTVKDMEHFDLDKLIGELNDFGDSVVAFRDGSIVKVHIHSKKPGEILNLCQKYGEFLTLKIENMTLQHNHQVAKPKKQRYGLVTVANGTGVKKLFKELGCDVVVEGGRGMNPSTEDFLKAFKECNAEVIFVFPNNKNTIMAARQAGEICEKAESSERADVHVIPTKDVGQGYGALSMLDLSGDNPEVITSRLIEASEATETGFVVQASKEAELDGVKIHEGEYFGFSREKVLVSKTDREEALNALVADLAPENVAILLKGEKTPEEEFERVMVKLEKDYRDVEFIGVDGGQMLYDYVLILM